MRPTRIFHVRDDGALYEPLAVKPRQKDIREPLELRTTTFDPSQGHNHSGRTHQPKPKPREFLEAEDIPFVELP